MPSLLALAALSLLQAPPAAAPGDLATRTIGFWATTEKGEPVTGLSADEVAVIEDGSARVLTRLVRDTRPLSVVVLVDSSAPLATAYRLNMMDAVAGFVRELPPGARYALWTTGDRPQKAVDLTDDRGRALPALRKVFPTGGNTLMDALVEASQDLGQREGERTLLVVVSGVGIGFTSHTRQQVVDLVKESGVEVMAVQCEEAGSSEYQAGGADQVPRSDYDYVLANLTRGGVYERPLSTMGVGAALQKVNAALAGAYRATYVSPDAKPGRKLEVQVARPGVKVRLGGGGR